MAASAMASFPFMSTRPASSCRSWAPAGAGDDAGAALAEVMLSRGAVAVEPLLHPPLNGHGASPGGIRAGTVGPSGAIFL
jgi:hypothetical protein